MSIKILNQYCNLCKKNNIKPTFDGLKKYNKSNKTNN
jgi:hypothetical protein